MLRATSRKGDEEERIGGYIHDSDYSDSDCTSDEDDGDGETPARFTSDELLASVGPYKPIAKYKVLPAPANVPAMWREMMRTKQFKWTGKRLAHILQSGWADHQKAQAEVPISDDLVRSQAREVRHALGLGYPIIIYKIIVWCLT